VNYPFNLIY